MSATQNIVYSNKSLGSEENGFLLCQIIQVEGGYIKQNIFPNGNTYEEDMTEEGYQNFLAHVASWDAATKGLSS